MIDFIFTYCSGDSWRTLAQWEAIVRRDLEEFLAEKELPDDVRFLMDKMFIVLEEVCRLLSQSGWRDPDQMFIAGSGVVYQVLQKHCPEQDGELDSCLRREIARELAQRPQSDERRGRWIQRFLRPKRQSSRFIAVGKEGKSWTSRKPATRN